MNEHALCLLLAGVVWLLGLSAAYLLKRLFRYQDMITQLRQELFDARRQ